MACHHLLAKMLKSHTLGWPAEENLISSSAGLLLQAADHISPKRKKEKEREREANTKKKLNPSWGKLNLLSLLGFIRLTRKGF